MALLSTISKDVYFPVVACVRPFTSAQMLTGASNTQTDANTHHAAKGKKTTNCSTHCRTYCDPWYQKQKWERTAL